MKKLFFYFALSLSFVFLSCTNQLADSDMENFGKIISKQDSNKLFLSSFTSDDSAKYYISGDFDGHKLYFASTFEDIYPNNAIIMNALFVNSTGLDNIHIGRENKYFDASIFFYFDQANIFKREIPYTIPHDNMVKCESVEISLLNFHKYTYNIAQGSSSDNFTFSGFSSAYRKDVEVKILSFKDNVMEGEFSGQLKTKTGSVINVKNGKFKIKIVVVNCDPKVV